MKIDKNGITFNYHGDELTWLWWWKRLQPGLFPKRYKYYSHVFDDSFKDLASYWLYVGAWNEACRKDRIVGYSDKEIFLSWCRYTFRHNSVLVFRNVNVEMRSTKFWKSLDPISRKQLLQDIPVLFFRDGLKPMEVAHSIEPEFAEVYFFYHGQLMWSNNDKYEIDTRGKHLPRTNNDD